MPKHITHRLLSQCFLIACENQEVQDKDFQHFEVLDKAEYYFSAAQHVDQKCNHDELLIATEGHQMANYDQIVCLIKHSYRRLRFSKVLST